jgi:hypothetical protein
MTKLSISNTSSDFMYFFPQISACGNAILDIEDKALDSSLLSLFNRRNHAEFISELSQQISELQSVASDVQMSTLSQSKLEALNQLIQALIGLATALSAVCEGLNAKTLSKPYSHAQYRADVKAVSSRKEACKLAQGQLFEA